MFARVVLILALAAALGAIAVRGSSGAGSERVYVVRPADTLWSIAASLLHGDPREGVWKLQERNRLTSTLLQPGQRLVVPP